MITKLDCDERLYQLLREYQEMPEATSGVGAGRLTINLTTLYDKIRALFDEVMKANFERVDGKPVSEMSDAELREMLASFGDVACRKVNGRNLVSITAKEEKC